MICFKKY